MRLQPIQKVYAELFSVYQKQQRLGEQYEVVLGLGALRWKTADGHEVWRHLVSANASLAFDSARGVITVGPAGEGAKPQLEQDMLDQKYRPDADELRDLEAQLAEIWDQLWDLTRVDAVLSNWVRSASSRGSYDSSLQTPSRVHVDPQVHLAPALILRRRTDRSFLSAFQEIIDQISAGKELPPVCGVKPLWTA